MSARPGLVVIAAAASLVAAPVSHAASSAPMQLPAAGVLLNATVAARAQPSAGSRVVKVMHEFGSSGFQVVLAVDAARDSSGAWWYELSLPGRPNGERGWVSAQAADLQTMPNRIVVHVRARTLEVQRIADGKVLLRTVVAVGKASTQTPIGRDFYVQARYAPEDPFYGPFVLQTSAYSGLRNWPGGGLVGIHGTDEPALIGKAVSHGCVRVPNEVALELKRLAPLGTPVDLLR
jgi:lipoprotein-anchoring transpeptidase ErfK/SrfK